MGNFGKRLTACRKAKKLTQTDLALMLGKTKHAVISNWENNINEPTLKELLLLADMLDTTPAYLLEGKKEYGLKEGYVAVEVGDALKYERMMRKELEIENARLKNNNAVSV